MSLTLRYATACVVSVSIATLALSPWLGPEGRRGVAIAGLIALPVQVAAFGLLLRFRGKVNGFLAVWAGGTVVRMGVVAVAAGIAVATKASGAVPMLLALAGFFFGLLLLEPVYFLRDRGRPTPEVR